MSSLTPNSSPVIRVAPAVAGAAAPDKPGDLVESTFCAEGDFIHRIDTSHRQRKDDATDERTKELPPFDQTRDQWLRLHASDLIDQLQRWSIDLDARQAQLNAVMASHDLRERQMRLRQQEIDAGLRRQQQELDDIAEKVHAQARRMAFRSLANREIESRSEKL